MSTDTENKRELLEELDRRFAEAQVKIDEGRTDRWFIWTGQDGKRHEPNVPLEHPGFVIIQIPGQLGGDLRILATAERLAQVRKKCDVIFNATPRRVAHPWKRAGSSPAAALRAFIKDEEYDNARTYAQVTEQIPLYKKLYNEAVRHDNV